MDIMQGFRRSAKPLIYVVAISFFAWLVLDLSGLTGGTGVLTMTSVGKINGQAVDVRVFQERVNQATQERQRQSPEPLGIAEMGQIRDQVWEAFVQEALLSEEYREWGISVTSKEIAEAIRLSPPAQLQSLPDFHTEGKFDQTKYERWLASSVGQSYVPVLEAEYRGQFLQAKLARHLVAPLIPSDAELWERFRDENEQVRVGVVDIPMSMVAEGSVDVGPSEVEAYHRTNREEFRRETTAWLSYLVLDRRPIASDTTAALARATSVRAEILGGAPFEEVAGRESSDTVSGNRGGDLGTWGRGQFDPTFERVGSTLPLHQVSEPVLTRFGYHLIEITDRKGDSTSGRHILIPVEVTGSHRDELDARADSLEALAAERLDPAGLDTAASALGLTIERAGPVSSGAGAPGVIPDASEWAFQAKPGEHSPVLESPTAFFVYRLDSLQPAGIPSLKAIRPEVERKVLTQKRQAETRRLAEDLIAKTPRGTSLEQAARERVLPYSVMGPFSRLTTPLRTGVATGAAFGLQPGEVSRPIAWEGGYTLLQGLERTSPDSADFASRIAPLREQALQNARQLYLRQYLFGRRSQASIVDNRDRIFRTAAQVEAEAPILPGQPRPVGQR